MTNGLTKRPAILWILLCILLFQGISAVPFGFMFTIDPTGALIGVPVNLLDGSIFHDFFIPGLILFIVLGLGAFFTAAVLFLRPDWTLAKRINPVRQMHWTWTTAIIFGFALMTWITVQVIIIGFGSWLQPFYFSIGLAIAMLPMQPSALRHLKLQRQN